MNAKKLMALAVICVAAASPSLAGLVARWDFNNYDPSNPTSAAILAPTVGTLSAIPCTGTTASTEVTDGTLGSITVVNTGLPEGDYALSIPKGAHLKVPLPSGIVHDKSWSMRIRFYYPGTANTLNMLVSGEYTGVGNGIWYVSGNNLIQGREDLFGTSAEENQNTVGTAGKQKSNGWNAFRLVSRNAWHSLTAHYGPDGTSSTLDGYRCVSLAGKSDIRTQFTGDGFVLCASTASATTYISSVEVWEDTPVYRDTNGGAYIPTASRTVFAGCSLEALRDMYISVKGLGAWLGYARTMSSWEHIVTTDGEGNVTDLKIDLRGKSAADGILCDFQNSGADIVGNTLRMQWSLGWPNHYFTSAGAFTSSESQKAAGTAWNYDGYSAYNIYALPFRPLDGSLNWSMQMGYGKFGNPFFTIVGDNPTLTFDVAPQADSITLDCGRGDGKAGVTFAYASEDMKNMANLGGLNVGDGVALTIPVGVSIPGAVTLGRGASILFDMGGLAFFEDGQTLLVATGGIALPEGVDVGEVASASRGTVEFADDNTRLVYKAPPANEPITAVWTGGGQRATVNDPLNWTCWNYRDEVLEGAVPSVFTTITVTGPTTFNVPAGQTLLRKQLIIGSCSLEADCDWSGIGAHPPFVDNTEVDMNGHNLTVGGLNSDSTVTIKNEVEGDPSEFCVFATEDTVNTKVLIAGNVKFVKDGNGAFSAARAQTYTGGSELRGGTTRVSLNATQQTTMGASGKGILVRNATLELGGEVWYTIYPIVLDGGTILSTFSANLTTYGGGAIFGRTTLLSDSTFLTTSTGNLRLWTGHVLDLGGHALDVDLTDSGKFIIGSDADQNPTTTFTNGTMNVSNGTFFIYNGYKGTVESRTARLRMNCAMNIPSTCTFNVGDYEALYEGEVNSGTGEMNVYGSFKPTTDGFYGCTLQNGSTLDLSGRTGTWSTTSKFTTGSAVVTFVEGAEVTVNLAGRRDLSSMLRNDQYIVTWAEPPHFSVSFKADDDTRSRALTVVRDEGGIKLASTGIMILVK